MLEVKNAPSSVFTDWATAYSGCDGGDMGSRSNKSTWICGIEWGGGGGSGRSESLDELNTIFSNDVSSPPLGYEDWRDNLAHRHNWQLMKLLAGIDGRSVSDYKLFAEDTKPFVIGCTGYFKMNLYPLAFRDTSHKHWASALAQATGFSQKADYVEWIRGTRLPGVRLWVEKHEPKVIICTGITYLPDFQLAFGDKEMAITTEFIEDRQLSYGINTVGTLLVIVPFMSNRNGLIRNRTIQKFGERIRELQRHLPG